jgi:hypothetical protein
MDDVVSREEERMLTEVLDVARSLRPLARPFGRAITTVLHILFAEANARSSHL